MTNHTEALAGLLYAIGAVDDDDAELLGSLAQAILASPVIAAIRAEERAGIVAFIRDQDGHGEWQEVADAIEARQHEGGSDG